MTGRNPTRLDASARVVLAWCQLCPPWRQLRADRATALTAAAEHAERVHQLPHVAADLREQARRIASRHAEGGR